MCNSLTKTCKDLHAAMCLHTLFVSPGAASQYTSICMSPNEGLCLHALWAVGCRFGEDIALQQRMSAIGDIIQEHDYPHFICLQVLTHR